MVAGLLLLAGACMPRLDIVAPGTGGTDSGVGDGGAGDGGVGDGGVGDGGVGDGGVGDGGTPVLVLDGIAPQDGPTNGGISAEILGGPFDDSVQVVFGTRGADVTKQEDDRLVVAVPPSAVVGAIDVQVSTDAASNTLEGGFTYWPFADGSSQIVGMWLQLTPPTSKAGEPIFDSWVRLVDPQKVEPWERYGIAKGSCGTPGNGIDSLVGPEAVSFGHPGDLLTLAWDDVRQEYVAPSDSLPTHNEDAPLDLQLDRSDFSPPLDLSDVGRTPTTVQLTAPDMRTTPALLQADDATLEWNRGSYDYLLVLVGDSKGTLFMCIVDDTGSFTLSADLFDDLDYEPMGDGREYATVWLAAAGVNGVESTLEYSGGRVRIDAGMGQVGAVAVLRDEDRFAPEGPADGGLR